MSFQFTRRKPIKERKILGHIPDPLTKIVDRLMSKWKNLQVIDKVDVKNRVSSKGTRVPGGGIEITYSKVPNNRAPPHIIFGKIFRTPPPPPAVIRTPPFINF